MEFTVEGITFNVEVQGERHQINCLFNGKKFERYFISRLGAVVRLDKIIQEMLLAMKAGLIVTNCVEGYRADLSNGYTYSRPTVLELVKLDTRIKLRREATRLMSQLRARVARLQVIMKSIGLDLLEVNKTYLGIETSVDWYDYALFSGKMDLFEEELDKRINDVTNNNA